MKLDYKDCGTIGFTCSTFDLLHAGHVVMLEEAKRHCDYLIVGLQNDPTEDRPEKNKPIQSIVERQIQLSAIKYVDEIVVYNTEADLDAGGKTEAVDIAQKADAAGVDPSGKTTKEVADEIASAEE
jgi:cytidyltransferase-like protein